MQATEILAHRNLHFTKGRKLILDVLLKSKVALSEKEIRFEASGNIDRATVYRTLKKFTDNGIIHPVITDNNITKYMIRKDPENHLHFRCTSCDDIFCLTHIQLSSYELPEGFVQENTNFLVSGKCKECNYDR